VHRRGYRGVYDFADPDSSVFIIATGQSGHPLSRHYDDLGELWRRGEYIPMSLDPDLARAAAVGVMVLTPAARMIRDRPAAAPGDLGARDRPSAVMSHPQAMRYWSTPEHETLEETRLWLRHGRACADSDDFLDRDQGRRGDRQGRGLALPEVGFLLHPDHWRQGLAPRR
jgi:hypothetical protein